MKRNGWTGIPVAALLVALAAAAPPTWADGIDDFSLTKAIPADVFMAVHSRDHAGKAFVNKQWERVWKAVEAAHFERDIKRLLKGLTQEAGESVEGFEDQWQQFNDLLSAVDWSTLFQRESAYAMKIGFPTPEWVLLTRPPADKVNSSFEGLGSILKTLAELAPPNELQLTTEGEGAAVVHQLTFANAPFPFGLTLARQKDVLLIAFGPTIAEQSLAMLRGEGGATLASTSRFQEAFKRLPAPTDELAFIDVAKLMTQIRGLMSNVNSMMGDPTGAAGAAGGQGERGGDQPAAPPVAQAMGMVSKVLDAVDMFEYVASVKTTKGKRTNEDSITVLRSDAKSRKLYPAVFGPGSMKDPLKFVPKNASDVTVTSGIDFLALYQTITKFIADEVPDAAEQMGMWEAMQEESGVNLERDILSWLRGGFTVFSTPGKNQFSSGDWVLMLTAADEQKAREMLDKAVELLEPKLAAAQGSFGEAEIEGAEGFHSLNFPMLAMIGMGKPTFGVAQGRVFVGSSAKAIAGALATGSGTAENFSANEQYRAEGLPLASNVTSFSFTDLTGWGEQVGQLLQMSQMALFDPNISQNPPLATLVRMVGKLGRVVQKMDFYQSSCAQSTFDGKTVVTKKVLNYREPPPPPERAPKPAPPDSKPEGDGG